MADPVGKRLLSIGSMLANAGLNSVEGFAKAQLEDKPKAGGSDEQAVDGPSEDPQALFFDPFSIIEQLGYKEKPSSITYGTLDAMIWKVPLLQGIIITRLNQISSFCRVQDDIFKPGFRITPRDRDATLSAADKKFVGLTENMMLTTGVTMNPLGRDSLKKFTRKFMRDSMKYDQACAETVKNRKGEPAQFWAVDASTIRLADTPKTYYDENDPDQIYTVQVYDNTVVNEWTRDQMSFCIRNPSTSIRNYGYGISEQEMLVNAITSILWAWDYNQRFFSQGSVAKGVLNIKGPINQKQLRSFRRQWHTMVSGIENAFRSPVLNSDDVQWLNMQQSNRDMEFSAWFDFLIKTISAVWGMDPEEVNFKYGNTGQSRAMFEGANKQKLVESKDKGLKPMLEFLADYFTDYIIRPIEPDFKFEFVGLEAQTQDELAKLNAQRVKTTHTVNELRAEQDLEPLEHGDILLDPVYAQQVQMAQQQEMQAQMGDEGDPFGGGDEDEEDDDFGEDDFNKLMGGPPGPGGKGADDGKPTKPAKPEEAEKSMTKVLEFAV